MNIRKKSVPGGERGLVQEVHGDFPGIRPIFLRMGGGCIRVDKRSIPLLSGRDLPVICVESGSSVQYQLNCKI